MSFQKKSVAPDIPAFLDVDVSVEGEIYCAGAMNMNGKLRGNLKGDYGVSVGSEAHIQGEIYGESVRIEGCVTGDLFIRNKLEILPSSKICGTLHTPPGGLIIHKGASLKGKCVTSTTLSLT